MDRNIITKADLEALAAEEASEPVEPPPFIPVAPPPFFPPDLPPASGDPDDIIYGGEKGRSAVRPVEVPRPAAPPRPRTPAPAPAPAPAKREPDQWSDKLMKYTPGEAIGLYVALEGVVKSSRLDPTRLRLYLAAVLVVSVVFCWLYLERVWKVTRPGQRLISIGALVAFVFGTGGVFATFPFYEPLQGTAMVIAAAAFLGLVDPPGPRRLPRRGRKVR